METENVQFNSVSLVTRLDNRVMDLRVGCFLCPAMVIQDADL